MTSRERLCSSDRASMTLWFSNSKARVRIGEAPPRRRQEVDEIKRAVTEEKRPVTKSSKRNTNIAFKEEPYALHSQLGPATGSSLRSVCRAAVNCCFGSRFRSGAGLDRDHEQHHSQRHPSNQSPCDLQAGCPGLGGRI